MKTNEVITTEKINYNSNGKKILSKINGATK